MYDIKLRNTFAFRFSVLNKNYRSPEISPSGLTTAAELPRKRRIVMHETLRSQRGIKPNGVNDCRCQWHLRLSFQAIVAISRKVFWKLLQERQMSALANSMHNHWLA